MLPRQHASSGRFKLRLGAAKLGESHGAFSFDERFQPLA
jgi:hypothetical protein